jgi:hypothetical protein
MTKLSYATKKHSCTIREKRNPKAWNTWSDIRKFSLEILVNIVLLDSETWAADYLTSFHDFNI